MRLGNLEAWGRNSESHDQSIACADCLKMPRVWGPPEETVLLMLLHSSLPSPLVSSPNVMVFYSVENNGNVLTNMQFFFQSPSWSLSSSTTGTSTPSIYVHPPEMWRKCCTKVSCPRLFSSTSEGQIQD